VLGRQTLGVGKDTRGSVATGREVPTRDEPSNLRRRKVRGIAARRGWGLVVCRRRGRRGRGKGRRVVRHAALWEGWDWHAGIIGVRAGVWHVISLRRTHVRIVDESRVLVRGVRISLSNRSRAQQFHDSSVCCVLFWEALGRCMSGIGT
jgi:hypothetical protein